MDDEAIAAMAMCGMVGGPASGGPALRTAVGEMTLGMSLEVRYRSTDDDGDGGFYRAKVSAIGDESIQVTYPETQVPRRVAPVARSAVATRGCMSAQEWHESTEDIPIAELTGARVRLPPSAAPAAAGGAWRRKDGSPEMWQASSPVEQDAPDSPRAVLRTSETLPPRRSSGGRPRRPVKRGAASGVVEAQAKAKRSRLKSVDVITTADTPFPGWTMERRKTWREKCSPPTPRCVGGQAADRACGLLCRYGVKWDTIYRPPTDFRFGKKPKATKMARSQNDIRQYVKAHRDCTAGLAPEAFVSRFSFTWNLAPR